MLIRDIINEEVKSFLSEELIDVESDVDMIYNTFFKNDVNELQMGTPINPNMFKKNNISSEVLKSEAARKANELNPVNIFINYRGNFYNPLDGVVGVGVNKNAIRYVSDMGTLSIALEQIPIPQKSSLKNEFSEHKIKGSIHHELTHWVDDTLHNRFLKKTIDKRIEKGKGESKYKEYTSTHEINAQIHSIKQMYNKYKTIWDTFTFDDIVDASPTIQLIKKQLNPREYEVWSKLIKKRLNREGLLGKKMR
jgi:hypothetical protein